MTLVLSGDINSGPVLSYINLYSGTNCVTLLNTPTLLQFKQEVSDDFSISY